ncbi:MAG: hypothetical protein KOO63_11675, partial [Bacteroidales bacterium]|nr:hypothetical protein [Candidatus Latescibacterota bacterium]
MGSKIEINDTLKLKRGGGFPEKIELGERYDFTISERRIYHLKPVRVFLVEEIEGKWNFVGQAHIIELTINAESNQTSGKYEVIFIYPEEYVSMLNIYDAPKGKGY